MKMHVAPGSYEEANSWEPEWILSKLQEEMRRLAEERVCGGPKPLGAATLTLLLGRASQLMPRKCNAGDMG